MIRHRKQPLKSSDNEEKIYKGEWRKKKKRDK
jgi:hypothetical protein